MNRIKNFNQKGIRMKTLQEAAILSIFDGLTDERKRVVLEDMIRMTKLVNYEPIFECKYDELLYQFVRKQWPLVSTSFFEHFKKVWTFLRKHSTGGRYIGCAEIGDVNLQAVETPPDYQCHKFHSKEEKDYFFRVKAPQEADWREAHVCHYPDGYWEGFLISDLMELTLQECDAKLQEYGYPSIIEE